MPKIDLGPVGVALAAEERPDFLAAMGELEGLGYSTLWLVGGPLKRLSQIAEVAGATNRAQIGSAILAVDRFGADEVVELWRDVEATNPGRLVLGLGGAHGPKPLATLGAFLDSLDAAGVPDERRVMAALGPRMLDLARERAAGALSVVVTPEYTAQARAHLGDDTTLAIQQLVVLELDPVAARAAAREPLGFLTQGPAYRANLQRMGFSDDDIAGLADEVVDALVAWGDADAIATRVEAHRAAGADHVALSKVGGPDLAEELDHWRALASRLVLA